MGQPVQPIFKLPSWADPTLGAGDGEPDGAMPPREEQQFDPTQHFQSLEGLESNYTKTPLPGYSQPAPTKGPQMTLQDLLMNMQWQTGSEQEIPNDFLGPPLDIMAQQPQISQMPYMGANYDAFTQSFNSGGQSMGSGQEPPPEGQ